jgi:hypothetical protein
VFGVSRATAHRRVAEWTRVGLWTGGTRRSWTGSAPPAPWAGHGRWSTRSVSARERGELTGPRPTDRGKPGSKILLLCDRLGAAALWTGHGRWSIRSVSARKGAISSTP